MFTYDFTSIGKPSVYLLEVLTAVRLKKQVFLGCYVVSLVDLFSSYNFTLKLSPSPFSQ